MLRRRHVLPFLFVLAFAADAADAKADQPQGIAVIAIGSAKDDAAALARAVYGSSLRPGSVDEIQARILIGNPPPPYVNKEVRELGDIRTSLTTNDDAPNRRLLVSLGQQIGAQGLLLVSRVDATVDVDGGAPSLSGSTAPAARLFLIGAGEFDAARYEPDSDGTWKGTVTSLVSQGRFLGYAPKTATPRAQPTAAKITPVPQKTEDKPFYLSPWLWGAFGAAVLIGGFIFFASQDTQEDPISVRMHVPR